MLNFKTKSWLPFLLFCVFGASYSQTQKLPDFAMQTPQAAALSKYSEYPVGSFTGVPSINVPLYTIECGDISFPIGLNYHAGGFKVTEEASWVGLGWTLTANGAITRTVNGTDDFNGTIGIGGTSYHSAKKIPDIMDINSLCYYDTGSKDNNGNIIYKPKLCDGDNDFHSPNEKLPCYSDGRSNYATVNNKIEDYYGYVGAKFDWEPDVYSINIMGLNGKFVLDQDQKVHFLDKQDIAIDQTNGSSWVAHGNDGFEYYFDKKEATESFNTAEWNGTWYITKIVSPTKREMKFTYDQDTEPTWQTSYSESSIGTSKNYNETKTYTVYLKRIDFDNGYVLFNTDATLREDIQKAKRLKTIQIYNKANTLIKEFELATSYFNTNNPVIGFMSGSGLVPDYSFYQKRLKLDKVIERNGTLSKSTLFNYSTLNLPNKDSYSQDHWGYYNGKPNTYLIPALEGIFPYEKLRPTFTGGNGTLLNISYCRGSLGGYSYYDIRDGANRDSNPATMGANVLKEIVYPTGGKTSFEFEANDCIPYGRDAEKYVDFSASITRDSRGGAPDVSYTTTIENGVQTISYDDITITSTNTGVSQVNPEGIATSSVATIPIPSNLSVHGAKVKYEIGGNLSQLTINSTMNASMTSPSVYINTDKFILNPIDKSYTEYFPDHIYPVINGPITLTLNSPDLNIYQFSRMTFSCKLKRNDFSKKYVGGLRVKKITHTDGVNSQNDIVKKYSYTGENNIQGVPVASSGMLKAPLKYWTKYEGTPSSSCDSKIGFTSSTKNGLTLTQSSHLGYSKVKESIGENGELGATQYTYYNLPNLTFREDTAPPGVPYTINQVFDGKLKSKIHFDNGAQAVQYESYAYQKLEEKVIKSIAQRPYTDGQTQAAGTSWYGEIFWYYPIFSRWEAMMNSTKGIYNKATNSYTETTMAYEYNPINLLPSKITAKDSNGNSLITTNVYADKSQNYKTSVPIEVQTSKNNDLLSDQNTVLSTFPSTAFGGVTLPSALETSKGNNPLETRIQYNKYDDKGNPLELKLTGGTTVAYIWGYNKTLPVAKIENATYTSIPVATITNLQALSDIDNDRCSAIPCSGNEENLRVSLNLLRASLPNAMVTTFTHDPLIGVTSITDAKGDKVTYEYDGFNRLKWILDKNGNKLSENEYHYKL
jgi:YD repeat-containing protein